MGIWAIVFPVLAGITLFTIFLNFRLKNQFHNFLVFLFFILFIPLETFVKGFSIQYYFFAKSLLFIAILITLLNLYQKLIIRRIIFEVLIWISFISSALLIAYFYRQKMIDLQMFLTYGFFWLVFASIYVLLFIIDFFKKKSFKIDFKYKTLYIFCLLILTFLFIENILLEFYYLSMDFYTYFTTVFVMLKVSACNINYILLFFIYISYLFIIENSKVKVVLEKNKKRDKDSDLLTIIRDLTIKSNELDTTIENILNISNFLIKPDGGAFYFYNKNENNFYCKSIAGYVIPPFFINDKILSDNIKLQQMIKSTKIKMDNPVISYILNEKKVFFVHNSPHDINRQYLRSFRDYSNKLGSLMVGSFNIGRELGGVIYLNNRLSDFNNTDLEIFKSLCTLAGVLIENIYSKELTRAKGRLESELQIAEKIQTSILPKTYDVPGYKICPYMKTADEVGGDYYDIINTENGRFWVNIGDVAGHGLTAGLLMMMLQTSASTNITLDPGIKPAELVVNVNRTIYDNIRNRLLLDQYITACFITGNKSGDFEFAGAHEDILIYRSKTKKVERINTDGIWLGLASDIAKFLTVGKFKLAKNDIMFIFTDGVIEIMNEKDQQYDIKRLEAFLTKMGDKEPEEIRDSLNIELDNFKLEQKDDITYVIVKKL